MTILLACAATAVLAFVVGTIFGGIMVGGGSEDAYKAGLTVGMADERDSRLRAAFDKTELWEGSE